MTLSSAKRTLLFGILAVGLLFYLATIRPGQRAGDFSMFMQHAVNIVEGERYTESTYVQNPDAISVGTTSYPPGLPILIAPLYAAFGFNLIWMKVLMVLMFFGALLLFGLTTERWLSWPFFGLMLVDLTFTPYFWEFKDNVEADFPFLLPCFLFLYLIAKRDREAHSGGLSNAPFELPNRLTPTAEGIGIGLILYAAVALRTIGLALLIALLLHDLVRSRRLWPTRKFWVPAVIVGLLMVLQSLLLPTDGGTYGTAFAERMSSPGKIVGSLILNAKYYILAVTGRTLLTNGHGTLWADVMLVLSLVPFVVGLYRRMRYRPGILEAFIVVYGGVLLVWPFRQPNYLIPLVPLMSFYLFSGLEFLLRNVGVRTRNLAAAGVFGLLLATYVPRYATLSFDRISHDILSPDSEEFYEYVRINLAPDDGIITRLPREVALLTERPASPPRHPSGEDAHYTVAEGNLIVERARATGFPYVAAGPKGFGFHQEVLPLWNLLDERPELFEDVWTNEEWRLVRVVEW